MSHNCIDIAYAYSSMFRRSYIQKKVLYSEGSMFRRSFVQKVLCSEGSIFRRFYIQKVVCSEIFVQKVLCLECTCDYSCQFRLAHDVFATLNQRHSQKHHVPSGFTSLNEV